MAFVPPEPREAPAGLRPPGEALPPAVRAWLEQVLGPFSVLGTHGAAVRLETLEGPRWLKRLPPGRALPQALHAHRHLGPRWARAGVPLPKLLHAEPTLRAIVLTEVPGRPGRPDDPPSTFRAAGQSLRALHALPCPQEPLPVEDALLKRAEAAARAPLAPPCAAAVVQLVRARRALLRNRRVWCHRDAQPRNWRVIPSGPVGFLDFEHMRPDHPLVDPVRVLARVDPERAEAFSAGLSPDPPAGPALEAVLAGYGLATVVWARQHRDAELLTLGERALARAGFGAS